MLQRMYIDNYRCFVNFDMTFNKLNLLLGTNGTGKTTLFEVLHKIKKFISGDYRVADAFSIHDLTRWQDLEHQKFEIELSSIHGTFLYRLIIEHDLKTKQMRVKEEKLHLDGKPLFEFENGTAHLFHDSHKPGPVVSFDWSQSGIAVLQPRPDNTKLHAFRQEISKIIIASVNPYFIKSESRSDDSELSFNSDNFVSWYRWLVQDNQGIFMELFPELGKILPGFQSFSLKESGEDVRILKVLFDLNGGSNKTISFDFHELSEGQKVLIELYTLLFGLKNHGYSLFLDEPDNYLALREIQPWLLSLNDLVDNNEISQAVLISHHPELIDYLGSSSGKLLQRSSVGPVRLAKIAIPSESNSLKLSELIARGWEDG